jgi:protein-disulfide isomerase
MFRNLFPSLVVLALAVGGSYFWVQSAGQNPANPANLAAIDTIEGVTDVQASTSDTQDVVEMTLGAADAPVTIVEYASFTCPHCARFHETVFGDLVKEYVDTGKVRFIMRDVYFDRFGLWAGMLARCETDKFFGVSDLLYTQQSDWTKADSNEKIVENLYGIGRASGLTDEAIGVCLQDNDKAQALVATYQTNAERDGIDSTPSFLINGKKYPNMSLEDFRKLFDELLAE